MYDAFTIIVLNMVQQHPDKQCKCMVPTSAFCVLCDFTSGDLVWVDSFSQISGLTLTNMMPAQFLGGR